MPFLFALLVLGNAAFFGYSVLIKEDKTGLLKEKAQLTQPMSFDNTSKSMKPLIGKQK